MPEPAPDPAVDRLIDEILSVMPDMATATVQLNELVAGRLGVSTIDLQCLHALAKADAPLGAGELAKRLSRTTGAVTRMIDRLEAAGYVERAADPNDRRRALVRVTERGRTLSADYYDGMGRRATELLSRFDEHQLRAVLTFVTATRDDATTEATLLRNAPATEGGGRAR
ncbi:MarR family transcriptional regulator [Streptomyces sp. 8K308]|uniref:MarR family winged helix-turn-helix transcriptional regulator n=1 Tax=Streptomyces sp. 8K308 TaxID=2530388 RepID=UPI001047B87D|nr:MarR family transcriptional regulator [Streptomyces sp. 8K308]TDC24723.1 MarR family transcriptional regulator [Streptomyces sp. 8K308]